MKLTKIRILPCDPSGVSEAARLLDAGALVAFPTETVYGLGGDATSPRAVAAIYAAKGRPSFNPLIAHVATIEAAFALGHFNAVARRLAEAFWPGPLTLVVSAAPDCPVCELARAGLASLAIRVPDDPIAHALLTAVQKPIAAPSANRSGHVSPSTAEHVVVDLGDRIAAVLDGGAVMIGVESTIISCLSDRPTLLRHGGVPREDIEAVLNAPLETPMEIDTRAPVSPGQLTSHYAPETRLRLNAENIEPGEACLAFGTIPSSADPALTLNLSPSRNLEEAAANLYACLRALDQRGARRIAIAELPDHGLGAAINDRLKRAAAPR